MSKFDLEDLLTEHLALHLSSNVPCATLSYLVLYATQADVQNWLLGSAVSLQ
jgi:hypothetical protein